MENDDKLIGKGEESNPKPERPKRSQEDFIKKAKEVHGDKYDLSKVVYKGCDVEVEIICNECGRAFKMKPVHFLQGHNCPDCSLKHRVASRTSSKEKFIEKARKVHGDKYNYDKVEYKNNHTKVTITCPIHGDFDQLPLNHIKNGAGCPKCRSDKMQTSQEDFEKKVEETNPGKYDLSSAKYNGINTEVEVKCKKCGHVFKVTPHILYDGKQCPNCESRNFNGNKERFIEEARKIHGDKYDYSQVENFTSMASDKVTIVCPTHGPFRQTPSDHLSGRGCYDCGIISRSLKNRKTQEEFLENAKKIHGDTYDYSQVVYVKSDEKVKIVCKKHGVFEQTPNSHLNGEGCPVCAHKKPDLLIDELKERIFSKFGERFELVESTFKNLKTKADFIDKENNNHIISISPITLCNRKLIHYGDQYFGESVVGNWLSEKNLIFTHRHPLPDLVKKTNPIVIDYYTEYNNKKYFIEYSGAQHYRQNNHFHKCKQDFLDQLDRDQRVRDYCKKNGIILIEIPYLYDTEEDIFDFLERTIINNEDPCSIVDCLSLIEII